MQNFYWFLIWLIYIFKIENYQAPGFKCVPVHYQTKLEWNGAWEIRRKGGVSDEEKKLRSDFPMSTHLIHPVTGIAVSYPIVGVSS